MLYGVTNFMQCLLWIPTEFCAPVVRLFVRSNRKRKIKEYIYM